MEGDTNKTNYNKMFNNEQKEAVEQIESATIDNLEAAVVVNGQLGVNPVDEKAPIESNEAQASDDSQMPDEKRVKAIVIDCARLNVRQHPTTKSKVVTIINEGDEVTVCQPQTTSWDWVHIQLEDGTSGFVMGEYIKEV